MSETHDVLGMHFTPSPADALPVHRASHTLTANGEIVDLTTCRPRPQTQTSSSTSRRPTPPPYGRRVSSTGFIRLSHQGWRQHQRDDRAERALKLADANTDHPWSWPLGDRAALGRFRDMMVTVRDRVQKLKSSGRPLEDTIAAKPTKDLDDIWGKGFMPPDNFVTTVYSYPLTRDGFCPQPSALSPVAQASQSTGAHRSAGATSRSTDLSARPVRRGGRFRRCGRVRGRKCDRRAGSWTGGARSGS